MKNALVLALALTACATAPAPASGGRLTPEQALAIGRKIWQNEGNGKVSALTHWNAGEAFASLGIGHFIWYPAGPRGPFTESFPSLLDDLEAGGAVLPAWLQAKPRIACPWPDRAAFYADFDGARLKGLREFLSSPIALQLQAEHAAKRMEESLPKILAAADPAERPTLQARFDRVAAAPNGVYALVDYVNFKGEGINPTERYDGLGWGLLQVLELMTDAPAGQPSVAAFSKAADAALVRRVEHAPPARRESERKWLSNWHDRVKTYLAP